MASKQSVARHARPFAWAVAVLFLFSWTFPVAAGLAKDTSFPKWWGTVDVGVAFVLAISAFVIQALIRPDKHSEDACYRIDRTLTQQELRMATKFPSESVR